MVVILLGAESQTSLLMWAKSNITHGSSDCVDFGALHMRRRRARMWECWHVTDWSETRSKSSQFEKI